MVDEEDPADLFAIPDFWRPSSLLDQSISDVTRQSPLFARDVSGTAYLEASTGLIGSAQFPISKGIEDEDGVFFKLPFLLKELAGQETKLQDQSESESQDVEAAPEPEPLPPLEDDDFWLCPKDDTDKPYVHKTWESFEQAEQGSRSPLLITEAGPSVFDALLASKQTSGDLVPDVLDPALYCACLLSLALGRSSVLFSWDAGKDSFVKTAPHLRISGLSLESVTAIDDLCIDCGNSARHLQAFAETTYSAASNPTRVALAGVVDRLVVLVRSELSEHSRNVRSVLQLQSVVQPAQSILSYFKDLVKKLAQERSDEGILSRLFQESQSCEYRNGLLRAATREVLRTVSKPWTDFVEEWIGLKAEEGMAVTKTGPGRGFIKVADKMWIDDQGFELEEADYFLDEGKMPTFIPEDMAQTIFETGRNLRFLREQHPEHPLCRPGVVSSTMPPRLGWEFDWDAISKLEARVRQYSIALTRVVQGNLPERERETTLTATDKENCDRVGIACFGKSEAEVEADVMASIRQLDQPLENRGPEDKLSLLLHDRLYRTADNLSDPGGLSPHWDLVPLLSFGPVIEAQGRLINRECIKLLFSSHHLRVHIDLLRQYFLLGNGLLCSRLSHALFDPNLHSAERKAGVALSGGMMGLRLGGRRTWPPASSELRLALMGVLSECYQPPNQKYNPSATPPSNNNKKSDLPGDLSFAVRDLSQEEIDRCMDPDSLEALDFLRLSYKPPAALRPIMAAPILVKYDRVFKLLLRVLRMLYVANELFHSGGGGEEQSASNASSASARFRIEARHFIRQVASYFFDAGVAAPWRRFEAWLDAVEAEVVVGGAADPEAATAAPATTAGAGAGAARNYRASSSSSSCSSPDVMRDRLERALDETMSVLLLRRRQAPVLGLLEETFAVILRFAKALRGGRHRDGTVSSGPQSPEEMYGVFRKKVEVFITVCRGLGEKMGGGKGQVAGGGGGERGAGRGAKGVENPVEQLLVMLDMSGFYGRRAGSG
ncbi:hypothetical protein VTK56DRAFT_6368 [Thermocarpiscus australiensis]